MASCCEARFRWQIRGQVQGVGFRPFVVHNAAACRLTGFVRNDLSGVFIEAQGRRDRLQQFHRTLRSDSPRLAIIESMRRCEIDVNPNETNGFCIEESRCDGAPDAAITVDSAVCDDCLRELFSPGDRRAGYVLTNCTACGPRFTIVRALPYDRPQTTMAEFAMCAECAKEYADSNDRRFHAQPIACPACGPTARWVDSHGQLVPGNPIANCAGALRRGAIVAIKGIGGFHLAVRASHAESVARLRRAKQRDAKPLAVMCKSMDEIAELVELEELATAALLSPARPIVLATKKSTVAVADNVAPGVGVLGVMLPYTPIHHLLFAADPPLGPLVMTSGNISDEPLAIDNQEALERLGGACDFLLTHDRPIERRVDDSVIRDMGASPPLPIRRSRGMAPRSVRIPQPLPAEYETGICVGGELKNTIAVVRRDEVILSQHLGDLKHPLALANFRHAIEDLKRLYNIRPHWVACDLHPAYQSSVYASELSQQWQAPLLKIQHHHAHAVSLMTEWGCTKPILAVVCDGVGYGTDGTSWGGELLMTDLTQMRRMAHMRPLQLAGGDAAAIDTRRSALALLSQIGDDDIANRPIVKELYPDAEVRDFVVKMLQRRVRTVQSTAVGRYFDGFAALLGLCQQNRFEAEAGMLLESAASRASGVQCDEPLYQLRPSGIVPDGMEIDMACLVQRVVERKQQRASTAELALLVHQQLAAAWDSAVAFVAARTQIDHVALTGGVMCNRLLVDLLCQRLASRGLRVLCHTQVPCNDGGLSLGQAAIAAAFLVEQRGNPELGAEIARRGINVALHSHAR